jgi:hypothetical protein
MTMIITGFECVSLCQKICDARNPEVERAYGRFDGILKTVLLLEEFLTG